MESVCGSHVTGFVTNLLELFSLVSPTEGEQGNNEDYKPRLLTCRQEAIKGALHLDNAFNERDSLT